MSWPWLTRHPSPAALVDVFEGGGAPSVQRHVRRCQACAARLEALCDARARTEAEQVPEPPAIFWTQLSAGISAAIPREPPPVRAVASPWRRLVPAGATAVAIGLLVVIGSIWRSPSPVPPPPDEGHRAAFEGPGGTSGTGDVDWLAPDDELGSWGVVLALAEEIELDEASALGMGPAPGAFDDAMTWLSDDERSELVRLIREELRGVE